MLVQLASFITESPALLGKVFTWPTFHQAVAWALKAKPGDFRLSLAPQGGCTVANTYKKTSETIPKGIYPPTATAGFWLAAGLQGKLTVEDLPAISELLRIGGQPMEVSCRLGFCASLRGTPDAELQMLPFRNPPRSHPAAFPEADWASPIVQATALISIGLLCANVENYKTEKQFKDTLPRRNEQTQRMLDELKRRPGKKPPNAPEEWVLSMLRLLNMVF